MNYKETLNKALKERGLTHSKLADKAGYNSRTAVSRYFNSDRNNISVNNLLKMLDAMGYSVIIQDRSDKKNKWELTR